MIVYTMTESELFEEVLSDMVCAIKFSDGKDQKFRRMVLKSSKFPVYAHSVYTSPRRNTWIILFEARNKKEIGENSRVTFVTYYNSPNGYHAVMPSITDGRKHLILYSSHFFSRYASRCNIPLTGIELIKHFFKFNPSYAFDIKIMPTSSEVFAKSAEGVCLGMMTRGYNILFKTFITEEMTRGNQIETTTMLEQLRKDEPTKNNL